MNKTERLTIRNSDGSVSQPTDTSFEKAMYRLAEYEDLGFSPKELGSILSLAREKGISFDEKPKKYHVQMIDANYYIKNDREAPTRYRKLYNAVVRHDKVSSSSWYDLTEDEYIEYEDYMNSHDMRLGNIVKASAKDSSENLKQPIIKTENSITEGDIVHKVYILCNKKETECDCPGTCPDCKAGNFCAHVSSVVYTNEKADDLKGKSFLDRESKECKVALSDLESVVDKLKKLLESRDKVRTTIEYAYNDGGRFKACVSVSFGNRYVIHGIKLYQEPDGPYVVVMPMVEHTKANGERALLDLFHPLNSDVSMLLRNSIIQAYEKFITNSD